MTKTRYNVGSIQSSYYGDVSTLFRAPLGVPSTPSSGVGSMVMMRHGKKMKKLNRPADQRKALLRGLTTEVIRHGRIKTNFVRAMVVRGKVDHMIELAKRGTLHARRQALAYIYDKNLVRNLFAKVQERYGDRNGGYTRVLKTMSRRGDNTKMGIIELV